ncbi:MAG: hypothetical protein ACKVH8_10390, partial [Pirellulales bacterium]
MDSKDQSSVVDLTDFIISRFRREFGLWFEINEGWPFSEYINEAAITDGESQLFLYLSMDSPVSEKSSFIGEYQGVQFYLVVPEKLLRLFTYRVGT